MKNERATSSKAAMKDLLGDDGISGTLGAAMKKITDELNDATGTSLAGKIKAAQTTAALDIKAEYGKFSNAIDESVAIIDKALESIRVE